MRLTKNGKYNNYEPTKPSDLYPAIDKLGELEDILEKYHIEDAQGLDNVLSAQMRICESLTKMTHKWEKERDRNKCYDRMEEIVGLNLSVFVQAMLFGITYFDGDKKKYVQVEVNASIMERCFKPREASQDNDRTFPFREYNVTWTLPKFGILNLDAITFDWRKE